MTKSEIKSIGHMDYLVPFTSELTIPYRAKMKLQRMVDYLFKHPTLPPKHRKLYIDVSTSGSRQLVNDMSIRAIAMVKHFVDNQPQYNHNMENIQFQILHRMWRQTYKHSKLQNKTIDDYYGAKMKTLGIENGLWDELLRVVKEEDYIVTNDSMVKRRKDLGLRERKPMGYSEKLLDYYDSLV